MSDPEHADLGPALALQTSDGNLYLISWDVIQRSRVPDEHTETVARLLDGDSDVSGFIMPSLQIGGVLPSIAADYGEMESLRLQMHMDRMAKAMSMVSNLMKKQSALSGAIIANMK